MFLYLFGLTVLILLFLAIDRWVLIDHFETFTIEKVVHMEAQFDPVATAMQYGGPDMGDLYYPETFRWWIKKGDMVRAIDVSREDFRRKRVGDTVMVHYSVRRLTRTFVCKAVDPFRQPYDV